MRKQKFCVGICLLTGLFVLQTGLAHAIYNRAEFKAREPKTDSMFYISDDRNEEKEEKKSVWKIVESDISTLRKTAETIRSEEPKMAAQIDGIATRLSVLVEPEEEVQEESAVEPQPSLML